MSGLDQHEIKLAKAIRPRYSVEEALGSGGQSSRVKTAPDTQGVDTELHSDTWLVQEVLQLSSLEKRIIVEHLCLFEFSYPERRLASLHWER